ncbi:hypothetical protein OKW21_004267 [Catalinimonas alkaloidigena]|uniref:lipocalin family protein n=1 Tax=Catalinimonas alkaloidigena TaxID=1075417 RepID=UPI0024055E57|nr:lipocalin family protein [Catalinimonas alkaloidigena]MDF9799004.1 hypothetical protein [Catalinimonas alkaloidigena]
MKKLNAILLLSALILTSACEKDDDEPEAPVSIKTQMLIAPSWKTTGYYLIDVESSEIFDLIEEMPCYKDNFLKFNKNGKFEMNEGSDICEDEEQVSKGSWKFNTDESKITFTDEDGPQDVEILELSEDEFIFAIDEVIVVGESSFIVAFAFEAK